MGRKVRLLLIGYGFRGRQWHDHGRRRRRAVFRGAVDSDPDARAAAEAAGLPVWASLQEALRSAGSVFDAAVIATPPEGHVTAALACLRAGLAVLVEKPLALDLKSAAGLAREAQTYRRPLLVAQNFRFLPRERALLRVLRDGTAGTVLSSVIESSRSQAAVRPAAGPIDERALWDYSLHHFDALRLRFGLPARVYGETSTFRVVAALNWAEGLYIDYRHDDEAMGYRYAERLEGTEAAVVIDDQRVTVEQQGKRPRRARPGRVRDPEDSVLDQLVAAISGGETSSLSAEDNVLTMAVAEAVVLSGRLHRPVTMAEVAERAGVPLGEAP